MLSWLSAANAEAEIREVPSTVVPAAHHCRLKSKVRYAKYAYDIYANENHWIVLALIIGAAVLYPTSIAIEEHDFNGFELEISEEPDFELKHSNTDDGVRVEYANGKS